MTFKQAFAKNHSVEILIKTFLEAYNNLAKKNNVSPLPSIPPSNETNDDDNVLEWGIAISVPSAVAAAQKELPLLSALSKDGKIADVLAGIVSELQLVPVKNKSRGKKIQVPTSPVVFFKAENTKHSPISPWLRY